MEIENDRLENTAIFCNETIFTVLTFKKHCAYFQKTLCSLCVWHYAHFLLGLRPFVTRITKHKRYFVILLFYYFIQKTSASDAIYIVYILIYIYLYIKRCHHLLPP